MQFGSGNVKQSQAQAALVVEPKSNFDTAAFIGGNLDLPAVAVPPTKVLLTVRDFAAMTSLSEKTVRRLLQRGKIRALSSIRHKRIPATELSRYIREDLS